jgi:uncharacterized membrane protein
MESELLVRGCDLEESMNTKAISVALLGAAAAGVALGYRSGRKRYSGIKLKKDIVIRRPAAELYAFWRNFENLPHFAPILESVRQFGGNRSRWTVRTTGGIHLSWDAEITKDIADEMIGWRSVEGSMIETAGYVRFEPVSRGRATRVRLALEYDPPAGRAGAALLSIFGKRPGAHVDEMLRSFKRLMESGSSTELAGSVPSTRTGTYSE